MLALSGCGGGGPEIRATGSADDATAVLTRTLDAWKSGATPDSLNTGDSAVVVIDADWQAGRKLTAFELPEPGIENGGHWRVAAKLTMDGRKTAETTFYAVTPGCPASVIRSDFNE